MSQKIGPHLWFEGQAKEAAEFYVAAFSPLDSVQGKSQIKEHSVIKNTPSGDCDFLVFELAGYEFMAISAGPLFKFNPSISFILNFDPSKQNPPAGGARENLDALWEKLSAGGKALMPLDKYPFSERYGWIQDKYGVSWQLILSSPTGEERPFITPSLMFTKDTYGKAEAATDFYISVFKNSPSANSSHAERGMIARYPKGMEPEEEGKIMYTDFTLEGQRFAAMESAREHEFIFNEAISFLVHCDTQEEIDYYWSKLSAAPEFEQCGWLKDKYGVSWQINPKILGEFLTQGTEEQIGRVTQAFLTMKKIDIESLKKAHEGK